MSFNLYKQFATDDNKEEQGIWVEFENGISFRIRRLSSEAAQNARKEAEKPYVSQIRRGALPQEVAEKIAIQQLARGVIADWKGLQKQVDGEWVDVPYSPDAAVELLSDDKLTEFRSEIFQISLNRDAYKTEDDQDALGN